MKLKYRNESDVIDYTIMQLDGNKDKTLNNKTVLIFYRKILTTPKEWRSYPHPYCHIRATIKDNKLKGIEYSNERYFDGDPVEYKTIKLI